MSAKQNVKLSHIIERFTLASLSRKRRWRLFFCVFLMARQLSIFVQSMTNTEEEEDYKRLQHLRHDEKLSSTEDLNCEGVV